MTRTVKVGLEVDEQPYVRGMDRAEKATAKVADAADDATDSATALAAGTGKASESVDDLGDSAKSAGRGLNDLRDDAAKLDRQIEETSRGIRDLAREIARTSDEAARADLSDKLTAAQGNLRGLTSVRKLIDFDDNETREQGIKFGARFSEGLAEGLARAGGPISAGLSSVFGGLPPQAQAGIGAGVIAAVSSVAPLIGGVVSGAVVGGIGVGGVVGGIAAVAQHPAVKASATLTGQTFVETMQQSARSFVPAILDSLGLVRSEIVGWQDDFERVFAKSARFVQPLTKGALGFVDSLLPGVEAAIDRAGPIIDELASWGPELGDLLSDVFTDFSENAAAGARALAMFWAIFETGVRMITGTINSLAAVYGWMEKLGLALTGNVSALGAVYAAEQQTKEGGDEFGTTLQDLIAGFGGFGATAATAAAEVETLGEMIDRLTGANLSAEQANIALEAAIDRATEAGRKNNDGISANTEKGRANREALLGIAEAAAASHDAILEQTGSQDLASDATERGKEAFLRAASAMGVSKAEAKRLADQLFALPAAKDIAITANTGPAIAAANALKSRIDNMSARINVYAEPHGSFGGGAHTGFGNSTGMRWGGVRVHAAEGVLRQAQVAPPTWPARYAWAEPATGGEAFVPRYGDRSRSLNTLETAAGWYGKTLASQPPTYMSTGGGGAVMVSNAYSIAVNVPPSADPAEVGRQVVQAITQYERGSGAGWRQP